MLRLTFLVALCAVPLRPGTAQRAGDAVVTARGSVGRQLPDGGDSVRASGGSIGGLRLAKDSVPATAWAVLASAVLPGTGQALLGQDRFIAYLAVEAFAWARYRADAREGQRARATYRRLASEVARRPFSAARPVGDFEYYERMEKFEESGVFDAIEGGLIEPESDTTTANGAIWLLARQTYWSDPNIPPAADSPEYARAANFYRERAIRPEYRWSWSNARLEYAEFRRTIRRSNNAYRTSVQDLGLVIANHALSTVDAFITVRLRRQGDSRLTERYEVFGTIPFR